MPEDMPEDMSEYMPEDMSDRMPEDMSEYMPEDMPDRMPEDMSDRVPEDMPDRMPEDLPDRMPEDMPDHMPEDMPDRMSNRMSEDMSDRMPEDLPVRKCINVMVGITRSKVILKHHKKRVSESRLKQCQCTPPSPFHSMGFSPVPRLKKRQKYDDSLPAEFAETFQTGINWVCPKKGEISPTLRPFKSFNFIVKMMF